MNEPQRGPLSGIKVLELGQIAAAPFTGMLLADLGADVVKVERPDSGDGMRQWPPLLKNEAGEVYSGNFASLNRNKRSITIDFKDDHQSAVLKELCSQADVFIENYRPGVLSKLGLGYENVAQLNPRIVYCSISGYGQVGSYSQKGAFDVTIQAISGLMSVTGESSGPPVKCGVPVADFVTGLYAAYSITAALRDVERTNHGTYIDCPMLTCLLGISALQTSEYYGTGEAPKRLGSAHPRNAPYQAYQGSDRPFVIAAGNDKLWQDVCELVDMPDLAQDPRFQTQVPRAKNQAELERILQAIFHTRPADYWLTELDRRGVPCAPINSFPEILEDPNIFSSGLIENLTLPNGFQTPTVGYPVKLEGYELNVFRNPPALGAHNEEVYADWLSSQRSSI